HRRLNCLPPKSFPIWFISRAAATETSGRTKGGPDHERILLADPRLTSCGFVRGFVRMKTRANEAFRFFQLPDRFFDIAAASAASVILLLFSGCSATPTENRSGSVTENSALREDLLRRAGEDQTIRDEMIRRGSDKPDKSLQARMNAIDADNQ